MNEKEWAIRQERASKVHSLLDGKVPDRVTRLVARGYLFGELKKPLDELTDKELLAELWIGPKTLKAIRTVLPTPRQSGSRGPA